MIMWLINANYHHTSLSDCQKLIYNLVGTYQKHGASPSDNNLSFFKIYMANIEEIYNSFSQWL